MKTLQLFGEKRHFLVWGLAKTGIAVARYLAKNNVHVTVVERQSAENHKEALLELSGLSIEFLWQVSDLEDIPDVDAIILSPGVPFDLPTLVKARAMGIETVAALDWAARLLVDIPMIAVTGSAGKSTTVSLIGEILKASQKRCFVGGNLGTPLVTLLEENPPASKDPDSQHLQDVIDVIVVECSSFQLEATRSLPAKVAILTNLRPNHLDRHKTMERYGKSKARLFNTMDADSWVISCHGDTDAESVVSKTSAKRLFFYVDGLAEEGAMIEANELILRHPLWGEERYSLDAFLLRGRHNRENLMAASLGARLMGATPSAIKEVIASFRGLEHRLEWVGELKGVHYFNDSKATTPDSAVSAIRAFEDTGEKLHILLGGRSKGTGFSELLPVLGQNIKKVYLFGEAAKEIDKEIGSYCESALFSGLHEALISAKDNAHDGEVVVLTPACTSFDEFQNFEVRGSQFKKWVNEFLMSESVASFR